MPRYFILTISISAPNIRRNLVENLYQSIINTGFYFRGGYKEADGYSLDDIIKVTQKQLPNHSDWLKLLKLQVLFSSEKFSEIRGLWKQLKSEVRFDLIVNESDIFCGTDGEEFIAGQVELLKKLAIEIWEGNLIDAIQTYSSNDYEGFNLSSIESGRDILNKPFAIIGMKVYRRFISNYFGEHQRAEIKNSGILISRTDNLNKGDVVKKDNTLLNGGFFAEKLVIIFPEFSSELEEHMDYYGDLLGHIFFSDVISFPLTKLLQQNTELEKIRLYIALIEDMYKNGDGAVKNIVEVTILEYLGGRGFGIGERVSIFFTRAY